MQPSASTLRLIEELDEVFVESDSNLRQKRIWELTRSTSSYAEAAIGDDIPEDVMCLHTVIGVGRAHMGQLDVALGFFVNTAQRAPQASDLLALVSWYRAVCEAAHATTGAGQLRSAQDSAYLTVQSSLGSSPLQTKLRGLGHSLIAELELRCDHMASVEPFIQASNVQLAISTTDDPRIELRRAANKELLAPGSDTNRWQRNFIDLLYYPGELLAAAKTLP